MQGFTINVICAYMASVRNPTLETLLGKQRLSWGLKYECSRLESVTGCSEHGKKFCVP
jgi:hypothetical protein